MAAEGNDDVAGVRPRAITPATQKGAGERSPARRLVQPLVDAVRLFPLVGTRWSGPCRMVGPLVEQLAEDYAGKAKVGKINVDAEPDLARRYQDLAEINETIHTPL